MEPFPSSLESEAAWALLLLSVSPHMRHRAEAILRLLSDGCCADAKIRQELGDSPDTNKALRMLVKHEKVKRSGKGGRKDPFIYTIA